MVKTKTNEKMKKNIKVYNLVIQNKSNQWNFETKNKYPKNVKISSIKEIYDEYTPYNTTNMEIVQYLNESEMTKKDYEIQILKANELYDNAIKLEHGILDKEETVGEKPSLRLIKNKILKDYKNLNIEFGDMLGGKGDDDDDIEKIGAATVLWDLLKILKLTNELNPPPEYPQAYTRWTAQTGFVKL
jgi:hypothetical protein